MQAPGATLSALADPTRRQIVEHLATGTATVSELAGCFELSQPTISSHLKVPEHAGLIEQFTRPSRHGHVRSQPKGFVLLLAGRAVTVYEQNYGRLRPGSCTSYKPNRRVQHESTRRFPPNSDHDPRQRFGGSAGAVWRAHTEPELVKAG